MVSLPKLPSYRRDPLLTILGILASCEFLQDTETNAFQQSLVDTVDSCARTLLDTISMVLDFSKMNNFVRTRYDLAMDVLTTTRNTIGVRLPERNEGLSEGTLAV